MLICLSGCEEPNYFEQMTETSVEKGVTTTEEITTESTPTEESTTEHHSIFPDSVYEYDVTDTILVPD